MRLFVREIEYRKREIKQKKRNIYIYTHTTTSLCCNCKIVGMQTFIYLSFVTLALSGLYAQPPWITREMNFSASKVEIACHIMRKSVDVNDTTAASPRFFFPLLFFRPAYTWTDCTSTKYILRDVLHATLKTPVNRLRRVSQSHC